MTIHEALEAAKELFPADAEYIQLELSYCVGRKHGHMKEFTIWNHKPCFRSPLRNSAIVATSNRSWEHALAIAKSSDEDYWPEQDVDAEVIL